MCDIDFLLNPDTDNLNKSCLVQLVDDYIIALRKEIDKNTVYTGIIERLTNNSIDEVCVYNEETDDYDIHIQDNSDTFRDIIKKLKSQLETCNGIIQNLKDKNAKLQLQNTFQSDDFNKHIKQLTDEIQNLKETSKFENYKTYINSLYDSREPISLTNIEKIADSESADLKHKNPKYTTHICDGRKEKILQQAQIELDIITNLKSLLKELYENIGDENTNIKFEADILTEKLLESRNRLSVYIDQGTYSKFFKKFTSDMNIIIELFSIRHIKLSYTTSSYEKWIQHTDDYLYYCDLNSDIYQRLTYIHIPTNILKPFELFRDITLTHMCSPVKDLISKIYISSTNINNIAYIPSTEKDSFLVLNSIVEDKRYWTYDCFLLNTIRNITKKLTELFIPEFRTFYKDCFGHNNYIDNFQKMLGDRDIKRWKQYKILYENIRILSDEYMFGEIIRDVFRHNCEFQPTEIDIIKGTSRSNAVNDFKEAQKNFNKGEPYIDEQEYYVDIFDDVSQFNQTLSDEQYKTRWGEFLKVYYK